MGLRQGRGECVLRARGVEEEHAGWGWQGRGGVGQKQKDATEEGEDEE